MTADGDNSRIVDHRSPGRRTSLLVVRIHRGTRMAENASCAGTCLPACRDPRPVHSGRRAPPGPSPRARHVPYLYDKHLHDALRAP